MLNVFKVLVKNLNRQVLSLIDLLTQNLAKFQKNLKKVGKTSAKIEKTQGSHFWANTAIVSAENGLRFETKSAKLDRVQNERQNIQNLVAIWVQTGVANRLPKKVGKSSEKSDKFSKKSWQIISKVEPRIFKVAVKTLVLWKWVLQISPKFELEHR